MKQLGLLAFVFFAFAILIMLRRWPADPAKTFSQNAAGSPASATFYGIVMVVFLVLLSVFTYGWFIPALRLPLAYALVFGAGVAGQTVAALVPETKGLNVTVHRIATGVMYFATVPLVGLLAVRMGSAMLEALIGLACLFLAALITATLSNRSLQKHAMGVQVAHLMILAAALMLATYTA